MYDASPKLSKLILACATLGACLVLVSSVRARGVRCAAPLFALGIGLPAAGELLATGPLRLLRHRLRYRVAGVPLAILLGWYVVIHGSLVVAKRVSGRHDGKAQPLVAALVGTSLDLVLDPAGLDAGLWEWKTDGVYAAEIRGTNGRAGVPMVNYLGWISLVWGVAYAGDRQSEEGEVLPALLLAPLYLAAVGWALRRRKFKYLLFSAPFPVALYAALEKG